MRIPSFFLLRTSRLLPMSLAFSAILGANVLAQDSAANAATPHGQHGSPPADSSSARPPDPKQDRLISIVLLLEAPHKLDEHVLGTAVSKAVGVEHGHDTGAGSFVVAKPPHFRVKLPSGAYVVNTIDKPYFEKAETVAKEIQSPEIKKAVANHHAWLSIDWAGTQEPPDRQRAYQDIGKIAVALAGPHMLALYSPELDQFSLYNDGVATALRGDDPLKVFGGSGARDAVVSIRNDDPRLKAAQAEAQKRWPEFVHAFGAKTGTAFAVKGRILEGKNAEYMWIVVSSIDGKKVHGKLDNHPGVLTSLKMGRDLHISVEDVDDWVYLGADKKLVGGFTSKVLDQVASTAPTR